MNEPLPDLETKLKGDVADLVRALAEARAALKAYQDQSDTTTEKSKENSKKQTDAAAEFARLVTANVGQGRTALQSLQMEYDKTGAKVDDLRRKFAQGGDVHVFSDLKSAESDLGKLKGFLESAGQSFEKIGQKAGDDVGQGLGKSFSLLGQNPYVSAGMVAAGVSLAVPLLAALDGAIAAGIGAGGIAVGIVAAAKQPAVQAAFGGLKAEAASIFTDIGKEFAAPVAAGADDLTATFKSIQPELNNTFAVLAQAARPLIDGFGGFIKGMLPGLESGLQKSVPFIQELAADLPGLGADIGKMFDEFASGGHGAVIALQVLIEGVGALAVVVGGLAEGAGKAFGLMTNVVDLLSGQVSQVIPLLGATSDGVGEMIAPTQQLGDAVESTASHYERLNTAFATWIGLSQTADSSLLSLDQAQLTFNKELKKGPKNWDEMTAAGQKQVGNLLNLERSITGYYDSLAKLNPLTRAQTLAELDAAKSLYSTAKAAGATKPELDTLVKLIAGLSANLRGMPKTETVHVNVVLNQSQLKKVDNTLARFGGSAYANSGIYTGGDLPHYDASGVYNGAAAPLYRFGEVGPEALISRNGDKNRAISTINEAASWFAGDIGRSAGGMSGGGGGTNDRPIVVQLVLDSKVLATQLIQPVNRMNGRSSTSVYGAH